MTAALFGGWPTGAHHFQAITSITQAGVNPPPPSLFWSRSSVIAVHHSLCENLADRMKTWVAATIARSTIARPDDGNYEPYSRACKKDQANRLTFGDVVDELVRNSSGMSLFSPPGRPSTR